MIVERKNSKFLKCHVYIFVLFLIEKCVFKYRSRSQSSSSCLVAARLNYSSDTISRLNFKKKINAEVGPKILLKRDNLRRKRASKIVQ